jgi:protein-S-isoprenylcysteine O-methyltransferase Ste14
MPCVLPIARFVRRPICGGVLVMELAWAPATSPLALAPWALACVFHEPSRRREETWLYDHHPGLADYPCKVRRRFIPFLW